MEKLRRYADLHHDQRKYWGAVAGMVVSNNERDYALKNGFYVIVPSGDTRNASNRNVTENSGCLK